MTKEPALTSPRPNSGRSGGRSTRSSSRRSLVDFIERLDEQEAKTSQNRVEEQTFVTFFLDSHEFALPVESVLEVVRVGELAAVPHAPPHVRGLVNLRGSVLPVIEIKTRMGRDPVVLGESSRIAVVAFEGRRLGLLVDRAGEVIRIPVSAIEPPPAGTTTETGDYVIGVAKRGRGLVVLIDLSRLLVLPSVTEPSAAEKRERKEP